MTPVGPVLEAGEVALRVIAAIREQNDGVQVQDRGAYLRVLVPGTCVLSAAVAAKFLGRPFRLPEDLEMIMPSFAGVFEVNSDCARWESRT